MSIQTCPTDVVAAPAERIWELIARPREFARWTKMKLIEGPDREFVAGDRMIIGGLGLRIVFDVVAVERLQQLCVDVQLPFGVTNHEIIRISPVDDGRYRVTFS